MVLKDSTIQKIRESRKLRTALMDQHEITEQTLLKWLRVNYSSLIEYPSLQLIAAYLKQDIDSLVIKDVKKLNPVE